MTRHVHCEADLRAELNAACAAAAERLGLPGVAAAGVDVHVTTTPPLVASVWTAASVCPHGVEFFMEPTGEQIAAWNQAAHS